MESDLPEVPEKTVAPPLLPLPRNAQAEWDARRAAREAGRREKEERIRKLVTQGMVNRGPGSEWAKILLLFGVNPWTNKAVREILVKLDKYGPEWCEVNRETIGEWLRAASGAHAWLGWAMEHLLGRAIAHARWELDRVEVPERIEAYPWETGRRTRNLLFYVAPFTGSPWRRHTAILRRAMRLFSGVKIISCVTGPGLDAADEVREELAGFGCDWLEFPHDPQLGEVVAWQDGMLRLRETAAPGSVTFYGHTKGVARHALAEYATGHHWGDMMYETCLDYLPLVDAMLDHHVFAGPFRRIISLGRSTWHYSGTFYWFRQDEIWKREWDCVERRYAGGESWPGLVASVAESGCLFFDHTFHGESNPYDLGEFQRVIDPDYEFWKRVTRDFRTPGAYGVLGPYEAEKLGLYARQS